MGVIEIARANQYLAAILLYPGGLIAKGEVLSHVLNGYFLNGLSAQ